MVRDDIENDAEAVFGGGRGQGIVVDLCPEFRYSREWSVTSYPCILSGRAIRIGDR